MNPTAVRQWVRDAGRIVLLSGAGMSAESGVPTFRDAQTGLWARFRPEDLATEDAFRSQPALVWDWYQSRRDAVARVARSCPTCGNRRRPAVVWFGEMLPQAELAAAQAAAGACDLMLVVGTSGVVYPAAGLATAGRGRVVVINPDESALDEAAHAVLRGTAAMLLPQLLED